MKEVEVIISFGKRCNLEHPRLRDVGFADRNKMIPKLSELLIGINGQLMLVKL